MACLVNHSYDQGVFVLQVPISEIGESIQKLLDPADKSQVMHAISSCLGIEDKDIE